MSRKKQPTKIVNDTNSVAVTGDYTDGSFDDTGFSMDKVSKIVAESPMNYFVLTHHHILDLQISVHEALKKGFKVTGGVSSYFDNPLGRRVWMQAVVKDDK